MFHVQCERMWVRRGESMHADRLVVLTLFFGWLGALIASRKTGPREELGRDTAVEVPVRIASDVRSKLMRMRRQKKLKALLGQTPIYAELLREYPEARIAPVRSG